MERERGRNAVLGKVRKGKERSEGNIKGGLRDVGRRVVGEGEGEKTEERVDIGNGVNCPEIFLWEFTNNYRFSWNLPTSLDPLKPKCWCADTVISRPFIL